MLLEAQNLLVACSNNMAHLVAWERHQLQPVASVRFVQFPQALHNMTCWVIAITSCGVTMLYTLVRLNR
jgi:hypothetical protein